MTALALPLLVSGVGLLLAVVVIIVVLVVVARM